MKIAIIGYGKMGREIEAAAIRKGHEIILKVDAHNQDMLEPESLRQADVAVEFSTPGTARQNIIACFNAGVPVVSGTTGWTGELEEIRQLCRDREQAFFYASNFSIGVNIMFRLNRWLAGVMDKFSQFDVSLREIHHIHKKDAPSGTALTLAEDLLREMQRKNGWKNEPTDEPGILPVISEREGEVPGTHIVTYSSGNEILEFSHRALNRAIFAEGAVLAAEFIYGKTGAYTMDDMLNI